VEIAGALCANGVGATLVVASIMSRM
jgi:hypothetical protein